MPNYLNITGVTPGYDKKVRQDLKFRTGNFVWKVIFNIPLNPATVNNQNLSLTNSAGKPVDSRISYDPNAHVIEVEPKEPYSSGETYTLHVTQRVESKGGQRLKEDIDIEFSV